MSVRRDVQGGVATLTLDRPDVRNAFDEAMTTGLARELATVSIDDAVRCVVITGAGRGFSAGQDLRDRSDDILAGRDLHLGEELRRRYFPVVRMIRSMPKPVVAAVNGPAVGAGFGLACVCDVRVASTEATFRAAWARVGLAPDAGAAFYLPRLVGWGRAFDLMLSGDALGAEEALRIGLVTRVFDAAVFAEEVARFARSLAAGATLAFALTKQELERASTPSLDDFLELEARLQEQAGRSRDYVEGVRAFLEKREARFEGR